MDEYLDKAHSFFLMCCGGSPKHRVLFAGGAIPDGMLEVHDPWHHPIEVQLRSDGCLLRSPGPDGSTGTEDDIVRNVAIEQD